MDMAVNYYGHKYAERSYGYKYVLHKPVPNPLKFRRSMSGLENRALTRFESEVTPPPHIIFRPTSLEVVNVVVTTFQ